MNTQINMNKYKKQKARADKKAQAAENAVKFGLTKTERLNAKKETQKRGAHLDGHKSEK